MTIKEAKKAVEKVFTELGIVEHKYAGYTHVLKTKIGNLYIIPEYDGELVSMSCNFYDNPIQAKELVGHWKYNKYLSKKGNDAQDWEELLLKHFKAVI